MPLRSTSIPHGPFAQMYRRIAFGSLATFFVLDTRQYRSDQPCEARVAPLCPAALDLARTMLGGEQERWFFDLIGRSHARWKVLAQQIVMAQVDSTAGPEQGFSMDKWSGYVAERDRLLRTLRESAVADPVVLTGDSHNNWVNDLKLDFQDAASPTVATEFAGTSISSGGDGVASPPWAASVLAENPFVKFVNSQRGYVRCEVTPGTWRSDYRVVDYVTQPGAPVRTTASFTVEDGRPGAVPA